LATDIGAWFREPGSLIRLDGATFHLAGTPRCLYLNPLRWWRVWWAWPTRAALPATGTLFIDYWLDRDSQPRKLTVSGVLDDHNGSRPVGIDITMTFGQFGAPVDITPPPQADTVTCHQAGVEIQCG
jgi:hypothetical protein